MFLDNVLEAVAVKTLVPKAPEATAQIQLAAVDSGSLSTSEAGVAAGKVVAKEAAVARWDEQRTTEGALLWGRAAFRSHSTPGSGSVAGRHEVDAPLAQ